MEIDKRQTKHGTFKKIVLSKRGEQRGLKYYTFTKIINKVIEK